MECPHCGNTDSKVIDSRLAKDEITIKHRRQCFGCSDSFTTYESAEERLLPFLIRRSAGEGAIITNSRSMRSIMSSILTMLSEETEKLIDEVDKVEKAQVAEESKGKKASKKKAPAKKKAESLISSHQIAKLIRRHIQPEGLTLDEAVKDYEKRLILEALEKSNWVKARAARLLHINRTTLLAKIKKQNLAETVSLK